MVWGSVVAVMSLYSADRPRRQLAFLNNTESLKLAGKEKKSQGYCLTKKKKKKASKYVLKMAAVAFRVCVGNGVILILISFLTAGFVVHVKIGEFSEMGMGGGTHAPTLLAGALGGCG